MNRISTRLLILAIIAGAISTTQLSAQQLTFDHSGIAVDVKSAGPLSDQQALQALEESARQLRARIAAGKRLPDSDVLLAPAAHETGVIPQVNPTIFAPPASGQADTLAESCPAEDGADTALLDEYRFSLFPRTLFWQPPLANPWQPRMFAKLSSLKDQHTKHTIDTAIGGTLGLYRITPVDTPNEGMQIDFFAVVLSRWSRSSHHVTSDYRFGIPVTFAWGNWQAKVAYEHTSSHLGDDYILNKGKFQVPNVHDEVAFGLAYRFFDALRVYGIYGVPIRAYNLRGTKAQHFDWGVEWSRQVTTSIYGQPFAAFDMEFKEEQDFAANTTAQIGWQWQAMDTGRSLRLALEYFTGKSTYGQFFHDRERWLSLGVYVDF